MPSNPSRTARLEARIAPDVLAIVRRAAALQGRSVSEFVVAAALDVAERTVEQAQVIRLSVEDQQAFADAILSPPPLSPALQRAIDRHHTVVSTSR